MAKYQRGAWLCKLDANYKAYQKEQAVEIRPMKKLSYEDSKVKHCCEKAFVKTDL